MMILFLFAIAVANRQWLVGCKLYSAENYYKYTKILSFRRYCICTTYVSVARCSVHVSCKYNNNNLRLN